MYHHHGWKDVTKFTDSRDLAHRPSAHLLRWRCWSGFLFLSQAGLFTCCQAGQLLLQVLSEVKLKERLMESCDAIRFQYKAVLPAQNSASSD